MAIMVSTRKFLRVLVFCVIALAVCIFEISQTGLVKKIIGVPVAAVLLFGIVVSIKLIIRPPLVLEVRHDGLRTKNRLIEWQDVESLRIVSPRLFIQRPVRYLQIETRGSGIAKSPKTIMVSAQIIDRTLEEVLELIAQMRNPPSNTME